MRFDTRARPMVGPARPMGRLVTTTRPRQPDQPHPTVGGVVIGGRVARGVALIAAKPPGLQRKG